MPERPARRQGAATAARMPPRDRTVRVLMSLVDDLTVERDEGTVLRLTLEHAVRTLDLSGGATFLLDGDGLPPRVAAEQPQGGGGTEAVAVAARVLGRGFSVLHELGAGWMAGTPLLSRTQVLGVLVLFDLDPRSVAPDLELLEALGKQIGTGIDNARHFAALRAASERVEVVNRLTATLASGLEPQPMLEAFAGELRKVVAFDRVACAFVNEAGDYLEVISVPAGEGWGLGAVVPVVGSGPGDAALHARPVVRADLRDTQLFIEEPRLLDEGLRSYIVLPLVARGRPIGALAVGAAAPHAYGEEELFRLSPLSEPLGLAFENVRLFQKTRDLSLADDVTPLYNYRFVHQLLDRELPLCERYGAELSLIFVDLDKFKPINDQHGHLRGSRALREVGFLLRAHVRAGDYPARYGGDEFVVVMPQTGRAEAQALAEELRAAVLERAFLHEEGLDARLGASVGVATFPHDARTKEALLRLADERMYADKERRKSGR